MLSYVVALLAFLLFLYTPIVQFLAPGPPRIIRTPRPRINEDLLALETDRNGTADYDLTSCPGGRGGGSYSVHLFSKEPLIVYIENFLSAEERSHLLEISEPIFEPSTITHDGGQATHRDQTIRDSEVAIVPRTDLVLCIEERARSFQGWRQEQWIERLRTQRYRTGGHYNHHFDWSSSYGGWGRVSTFNAWVDGSASSGTGGDDDGSNSVVVGGGTEFPFLARWSFDEKWCRFIECDDSTGETGDSATMAQPVESHNKAANPNTGVVFKPLAGNAVYWENFRPDGTGRGWDETWHAGLPVKQGTKVGLNIWTWGRID